MSEQIKLPMILRILDDQNRLLERADQKAISLLTTLGVFAAFFLAYYKSVPVNPFTITLIIVYLLSALLAIICAIMAINPRMRSKTNDGIKTVAGGQALQTTFFAGILKFPSAEAYKQSLEETLGNEETTARAYIQQIWDVSRINAGKYKYVQRTAWLIITALITELTIVAYVFIINMSAGAQP
jgi:hypothetical protein